MAFCALSDDALGVIYVGLLNVLDPGVAVGFSSASKGLWEPTQAMRQQLRADYEAVAALCLKMGMRSCKELRLRWKVVCHDFSAADLATLGKLGSVLPALEMLILDDRSGAAGPDGMQRAVAGLGAGALPALTTIRFVDVHSGDAGASALAAALGRGALPRLKSLTLNGAAIGDVGLVALAPALRRRPALEQLWLARNPFGDEGITALVAPLPLAGAPPPPTGGLKKLEELYLSNTQVTDAGCAALAAALDSGALPALDKLYLQGIPASAAAKGSVLRCCLLLRPSVTCVY
eukprot:scaffold34994_cov63-Phaeocystis_antarctica.AAC.5